MENTRQVHEASRPPLTLEANDILSIGEQADYPGHFLVQLYRNHIPVSGFFVDGTSRQEVFKRLVFANGESFSVNPKHPENELHTSPNPQHDLWVVGKK